MRVLLVSTNRMRAPQPVTPLGLCLVASTLDRHGFEVRLLDLCFTRRPETELTRVIQEWSPEAIGLSIRNLDNGEYLRARSQLPEVEALVRVCRAHSSAPLLIGGAAVNVAPTELLRRLGADFAVIGDGEEALPALLTQLRAGASVTDIAGVYAAGAATPPSPARVSDLSTLPDPQAGRWLEVRRYFRSGAVLPVQSKRGCGFHCSYCTYPLLEGDTYRTRSPEAVWHEMDRAIHHWGVRSFEFVDSTFNHPYEHAMAICELLARQRHYAMLHTMGLNPAATTVELLRLMRQAGFHSAICTAESGSAQMLESLCKGFTLDQVTQAAQAVQQVGLSTLWSFMFGGPGETEATVRESLHFIETALGPQDRIICTLGLRIYPGTQLAKTAQAEGAINEHTDLSDPVFYMSPQISVARTLELIEASSARSRLIYLETIQRPSVAFLNSMWTALHLPGAAWKALPLYNRIMRTFGIGRPKAR